MDLQRLWQIVLADLELQVSKAIFRTFLSQTELVSFENNSATISCNQPLLINLIEKRYYELIKKTFDSYTKSDNKLIFIASSNGHRKKAQDAEPLFTLKLPQDNITLPPAVRLNHEYTFENFAVSSTNQMAYAAATAVGKMPGKSYNPLFLYGGVGVGKTHLMQGIGHYTLKQTPHTKIIYCTGEEFTNDIIEAIGNKTTVSFKKKYRRVNILLIDDIQFIAGKNAVQEEFFHTFNAIQQAGGQIVMTSDRPPEEIHKLEERLRSRFEGGLIIDIGQPDFELRCAILLIKAKHHGIDLSIESAKLIATHVENPRKLEGMIIRIGSEAQTRQVPLDNNLVQKILGKTIHDGQPKNTIKPEAVIQAVAEYFNLKLVNLKSAKRDKSLAVPRQILYYILRSELNVPLTDIGEYLGGRDHTTILHGVRKISNMISTDTTIRDSVMGIKSKLYG